MTNREGVITHLDDLRLFADVTVHPVVSPGNWDVYSSLCDYIDQIKTEVEILLKEQEAVVRCKDCENWIPGYITDHDDFIPPKCGKYQQMVGHSAADYCSLAERK